MELVDRAGKSKARTPESKAAGQKKLVNQKKGSYSLRETEEELAPPPPEALVPKSSGSGSFDNVANAGDVAAQRKT